MRANPLPPVPTAEERPSMDLEEARQYLGISRTVAYESAHRGEIPVIRFGRRMRVPTAALRRMLQLDEDSTEG